MLNKLIFLRAAQITGFFAILILHWSCESITPKVENTRPVTRLSNIPPAYTVSDRPLLTLSWVGDDPDGYVVAYKYRWSFRFRSTDVDSQVKPWVTILNIVINQRALIIDGDESVAPKVYKYFATLGQDGLPNELAGPLDSGKVITIEGVGVRASNPLVDADGVPVRYPVHENANRGTFIFDSQDTLNPHTFEIHAIDDQGDTGVAPAKLFFWTPRVPPPDVIFTGCPQATDTAFVLMHFTDTFTGIEFKVQGNDPNSRTIEYSFVVDRDLWPSSIPVPWTEWTTSTTIRVAAGAFPDPYAIDHQIYVRARNEFGSIDTVGDVCSFKTVYPAFAREGYEKKILIVNAGYSWEMTNQGDLSNGTSRPNTQIVNDYYTDLYRAVGDSGRISIWNCMKDRGRQFPGRGMLGQFSLVHIVGDICNELGQWMPPPSGFSLGAQNVFLDYAYVGGNILASGRNFTFPSNLAAPATGLFGSRILHVNGAGIPLLTPTGSDTIFGGVNGMEQLGYADVALDPVKIEEWRKPGGQLCGLPNMFIYQPSGFGEIVATMNTTCPSFFTGGAVGIRYQGITYNSIFLGFPLYYLEKNGATAILRSALHDMFPNDY